MKIIITGAKGQLGSDLVPRLNMAGHEVIGFGSKELDITSAEQTLKAVKDLSPECIINCGAYTKVDLAEKEKESAFAVNQTGAANLADAAEAAGAALIHVSTDFVFDGDKATPYSETDKTNPLSIYGASKLAGEEEIIKRTDKHFIVRTSWLYGTGGNNFVKTILRLAAERESLRIVYDQAGSPTWTADLASALLNIVKSVETGEKKYGVYHYSNEGVASWYDFAHMILEETARRADFKCRNLEPILTSEYPTPARRPAYSVFNKSKIKKEFGISIPHWRVSLRGMINELYGGADA